MKIYRNSSSGKEYVIHPRQEPRAEDFFSKYDIETVLSTEDIKHKLIPKQMRICRFCGQGNPRVSFNEVAHIIPEQLGRNRLYSDFECDRCNEIISIYENDLGTYLNPMRTYFGIRGKKKKVGFLSANQKFKMSYLDGKLDDVLVMARTDVNDPSIDTSRFHEGIIVVKAETKEYVPQSVYKALIHTAISALPKYEVSNYRYLIQYLLDQDFQEADSLSAMGYILDKPLENSYTVIYKRKIEDVSVPSHVCSIFFSRMMIHFPLLFHKADVINGEYLGSQLIYPPYFFIEDVKARKRPRIKDEYMDNLSSSKPKKLGFPFTLHFDINNFMNRFVDVDSKKNDSEDIKVKLADIVANLTTLTRINNISNNSNTNQ